MPVKMTDRIRRVCVVLCALWVGIALVRVVAWMFGHPGNPASLVYGLGSGAVGAVGLAVYALRRRAGS